MNKLLDFIRFVIISPELVIGLLVYIVLKNFQDFTYFLSEFIPNDIKNWKILILGIPIFAIKYIYKYGEEILNPKDEKNIKILKKFPKYWMLKNRIYYSIVLSILSLIVTIIGYYYAVKVDKIIGTIILLDCWSIILVSFSTIALARLVIKDIIY